MYIYMRGASEAHTFPRIEEDETREGYDRGDYLIAAYSTY